MLTFIYLHCQAPPSTFCRGRYRNFVDWLIDWLIQFCCFRCNVQPCCHTHDSRSTVIVYSVSAFGRSCAVEPWQRWLVIACGAWWSNSRIPAINEKPAAGVIYKPHCSSYWSQSQILVENLDYSLPHLHLMPPLGGFPSEYRHLIWYIKTTMVWLPDGEKNLMICLFVLIDTTHEHDRQTHTYTPHDGIGRAYALHFYCRLTFKALRYRSHSFTCVLHRTSLCKSVIVCGNRRSC